MTPRDAAETIARVLLGHDPDPAQLDWTERVIRTVLPRGDEITARAPTDRRFPPPSSA